MRLPWLLLLLTAALLTAGRAEQPDALRRQQFSADADDSDSESESESESAAAAGGGGMVVVRSELTVVDESAGRQRVKGAEGEPPPPESAGQTARGSPGRQSAPGRPQEPPGAEEPAEREGPGDAITEVQPPDLAGQEPLLKSIGDSYFKPSSPPKDPQEDDTMTEQERQGEAR